MRRVNETLVTDVLTENSDFGALLRAARGQHAVPKEREEPRSSV